MKQKDYKSICFQSRKNAPFGAFYYYKSYILFFAFLFLHLAKRLEAKVLEKSDNAFFAHRPDSGSWETKTVYHTISRVSNIFVVKIHHKITLCTTYRVRNFITSSGNFSCIDTDAGHTFQIKN